MESGDVFPIMLLEIVDTKAELGQKYIIPCGKIQNSVPGVTPFVWAKLVENVKNGDSSVNEYMNRIINDKEFSIPSLADSIFERID